MINKKYKLASVAAFVIAAIGASNIAIAQTSNVGLSNYKIDTNNYRQYSNTYTKNDALPPITAYLSNWTHYEQGYQPDIDELAKYDTILLSFFGLCGTEVGDPTVVGGVNALRNSCAKFGLQKFQLSTTDDYADLEKSFPGMSWSDATWLDPNPNGLLGVMKKLHEEKGTRVGISVFGWSLSNIASDAVKPENRQIFIDSLISFVQAYPFIGQLDIDWEYPGIKGAERNVFDPENDARNYKEFIIELRQALNRINRSDMTIGIASGAPTDKIDAAKLDDLVKAGVNDIHLMTYDFFGQWDTTLNHHTNLYSSDDSKWSTDKAIQYMINDLGIPSKNIQIGYANYSRNAIASGPVQPSPLKGDFTPTGNTAGTFEAAVTTINDIFANFVNIAPNQALTGKNGYQLYTDKISNADFLYNQDNNLFLTLDTPRTVFAKSQYALKHNLGGVFNWMADHDEGLMLNAAREGLGYQIEHQAFNMANIINSCGVNIESAEECAELTFDQGASLSLTDQQASFTIGGRYDLEAKLSGADESQIKSSSWKVIRASGVERNTVKIDSASNKLDTKFSVNTLEEPAEHIEITFGLDVELNDGTQLSGDLQYTLKVSETTPEITSVSHDSQYQLSDIAKGKTFSFTANAMDKADKNLDYQWQITSNNATHLPGTDNQKQLLIDTSDLLNKPSYEVDTRIIVTNKFGNTDSMTAKTTVIGDPDANAAPVASFQVMTDKPEAETKVELKSTSEDEIIDELILQWSVEFNGQEITVDSTKGIIAYFLPKQAGDYQANLTVTDVFGVESQETQLITVAEIDKSKTTWEPDTIYDGGDTAIYKGIVYTAKWWSKGDIPGQSDVWEAADDGSTTEWSATKVYNTGDTTTYNGVEYTAKWWTKGDIPAQSDVWEAEDDGSIKQWDASKSYPGGEEVTHQGTSYKAKWWANPGQEPGVDMVWSRF